MRIRIKVKLNVKFKVCLGYGPNHVKIQAGLSIGLG